ncbi:hypothetical protein EON65_29280 [archaeon]|nr:MAG: hypothetical protein EON65_29280 [archaeon]
MHDINEDDLFQVIYVLSRKTSNLTVDEPGDNQQLLNDARRLELLVKKIGISTADEVLSELVTALCQLEYSYNDTLLSIQLLGIGKAAIFASSSSACIAEHVEMLVKLLVKFVTDQQRVHVCRQALFALANLLYLSPTVHSHIQNQLPDLVGCFKPIKDDEAAATYALTCLVNISRTTDIRTYLGKEGVCKAVTNAFFNYPLNDTVYIYLFMAIGNLSYHCIENLNRFVKQGFMQAMLQCLEGSAPPLVSRSCVYALTLCLYTTAHIKPLLCNVETAHIIANTLQRYEGQVDIVLFTLHIVRLISVHDTIGNRIWNCTVLFDVLLRLVEFDTDQQEDTNVSYSERESRRLSRVRLESETVQIQTLKTITSMCRSYPSKTRRRLLHRLGYAELLDRVVLDRADFRDGVLKAEVQDVVRSVGKQKGCVLWMCK